MQSSRGQREGTVAWLGAAALDVESVTFPWH